jgi:hypothetical protein
MPNDPELVSGRHDYELLRSAQQDKGGERNKAETTALSF